MILSSQRRREGARVWVACALVGLMGAALVWRLETGRQEPPVSGRGVVTAPGLQTWQQGGAGFSAPPDAQGRKGPWGSGSGQPWQDAVTLDVTQRFRSRDGQLVIDATTLRTLEQVLVFRDMQTLTQKARSVASALPPAVQAQAAELAERYGRYDQARRMAVSPEQAPTSVAQMQAQFEALQALQREHFGPQVARQLFGDDDAVTARLLQYMADDADTHASLEDKAARAQARYSAELGQSTP